MSDAADLENPPEYSELRDEVLTLRSQLTKAVAAVRAFADHFGPLEDNHMLHDDCRKCFALARAVLGESAEHE